MYLFLSKVSSNYTPPVPITAPVMGFPVESQQPHDPTQVPPGAPQEPSVQVGLQRGSVFSHQWPHAPLVDCRNNPNKPFVAQLLQQLPAERVEQKEIPPEHVILKTTFDSLVQRCQLAAGDPVRLY